ncbi:alkyldihydroxyacetonephosphate synthase, peroxisomal [Hydra vulgaris]|uniref:Alkylglycerone-phosphate synthase n=1 Tax=Hydra vulgaris TaxID=6087 RepID=T2MJX0_HYDVU|nr:alkyldihydroxyacetonephosphate synthase, peroxisomal [Hydra vulgaris]
MAKNSKESIKMNFTHKNSSNIKAFPRKRQEVLRWKGWGYKDCQFELMENNETVRFKGDRYYALANEELPKLGKWFEESCDANLSLRSASREKLNIEDYPVPIQNEEFLKDVYNVGVSSFDTEDRVVHGHGQTIFEIFDLRYKKLERIPDIVIWPQSHDEVVKIVSAAKKHDVCIIPFGGGTTVSGAVTCPVSEKRMIVSLDMTDMNRILWFDEENLLAHCEAGIVGQDLEKKLKEFGFCTGHEPDSMEFSTLGGWVATRASGMKKNVYGNIEDLVVSIRMVTADGVMEKHCQVPRMSAGPDIHHFMLGSEGTLGVITEVTLRIRPLPEVVIYGSVVFPKFESGVLSLREIALCKCAPASIRLMDNEQFLFGQALKAGSTPFWTKIVDSIKAFYITRIKGFDPKEICVCTLLFEGSKDSVEHQQKKIYSIVSKYGGIPAGEANGRRGYTLTYAIAYLRDFGLEFSYIAESFETSVPWDRVLDLCRNTKIVIFRMCKELGVIRRPFVTCRVTQTYDAGACIYFYFGFLYHDVKEPLEVYEKVENAAREEVLRNGGSISHHHGVGKVRKQFLSKTISESGVNALKGLKQAVDPQNIFGVNNLL